MLFRLLTGKNVGKTIGGAYYVGHGRTRFFSVPQWKIHLLLSALGLLLIWSGISFFLIVYLQFTNTSLEEKLAYSRYELFNIQAKNDHIFEQSYLDVSIKDSSKIIATESNHQTSTVLQDKTTLPLLNSNSLSAALSLPNTASHPIENKVSDKQIKIISSQSNLSVKEIALHVEKETLQVKFELHNEDKEKKLKGYLWLIGSVIQPNGNHILVTYPKNLSLADDNFTPLMIKGARVFQIKNFSSNRFDLPGIADLNRCQSLTLGIADEAGETILRKELISETKSLESSH